MEKKMSLAQRIILAISATALWCLIMPPYLCGILGIPVTFIGTLLLSAGLPDVMEMLKGNFKVWHVIVVLLLGYACATEFVEQWYLSSKMALVASLLHVSVDAVMLLAIGVGGIVACLALFYILAAVERINKSRKDEVIVSEKTGVTVQDVLFAILLTLAFGMCLALNPWSGEWMGTDSAVYLYMGQQLREGATLYADVFDHKGVVMYWINALGLFIGNGELWGVWILELINAFVSIVLIIKVVRLFSKKVWVSYAVSIATLACTIVCMLLTDGNLTEEWALPWILGALYICAGHMVKGTYRFYEILLLGISCGVIIFIRANMIAVFAVFLPVILFGFIRDKKWKDIRICALNFCIGLLLVFAPVLIYCYVNHCLKEMWECYFAFNLSYSDKSAMPVYKVMMLLLRRLTIYSALIIVAVKVFYKDKMIQINTAFFVASLALASMSGRSHAHYAIILIPTLVIPFTYLLRSISSEERNRRVECGVLLTVAVFFVAQFGVSYITYQEPEQSEVALYLSEQTVPEDNVLILGNYCKYYFEAQRYTSNRFFYQTPIINVSDSMYTQFVGELNADLPEVIISFDDIENQLKKDTNLASVYKLLDRWCESGVYSCEVRDTFVVYQYCDK